LPPKGSTATAATRLPRVTWLISIELRLPTDCRDRVA